MIFQYSLDGLGAEFKKTEELEKKIAEFLGIKHAIMCSSGTAALFLAAKAMGAKKVAVPALSMIATANAMELAGCEVVFYDTIPTDKTVDLIIHVSLNGRANYLDEVFLFARENSIPVVEDSCQSFGSDYHLGKGLGTFGIMGCYSFSPHKILTAGNGGCVVTESDELAEKVRKLKNFGRVSGGGDIHDTMGYNFKFTDIQADYLLSQFESLEWRVERKKAIYTKYKSLLGSLMLEHTGTPWFMDIYTKDVYGMIEHLFQNGVGTRQIYPLMPSQSIYGPEQDLEAKYPISFGLSQRGLWLPSSLYLTDDKIEYISNKVLEYEKRN